MQNAAYVRSIARQRERGALIGEGIERAGTWLEEIMMLALPAGMQGRSSRRRAGLGRADQLRWRRTATLPLGPDGRAWRDCLGSRPTSGAARCRRLLLAQCHRERARGLRSGMPDRLSPAGRAGAARPRPDTAHVRAPGGAGAACPRKLVRKRPRDLPGPSRPRPRHRPSGPGGPACRPQPRAAAPASSSRTPMPAPAASTSAAAMARSRAGRWSRTAGPDPANTGSCWSRSPSLGLGAAALSRRRIASCRQIAALVPAVCATTAGSPHPR